MHLPTCRLLLAAALTAFALPACAQSPVKAGSKAGPPESKAAAAPTAKSALSPPHLLDRLKALAGDWSAEGLDGNSAPNARMRYEVTANGSAVVETLFPGSAHEMRTVYVKDGDDVVLTHYCASTHHPRMRAKPSSDGTLRFEFDGAMNFDPARDPHMHDATLTFVGPDQIRSRWSFWLDGKPAAHSADFHARRINLSK